MREKYESLSLSVLKELAKARGLKGVSLLRKPEMPITEVLFAIWKKHTKNNTLWPSVSRRLPGSNRS